jgi:hypothetical protein
MTWRQRCRRIVEQTLRDLRAWNPGASLKEKRAALREAYP